MAVKVEALPGNVYLLTLAGNGEHRLTPTSIPEILAALDKIYFVNVLATFFYPTVVGFVCEVNLNQIRTIQQVESDPNAAALVTTGEGRFYSNGLSLSLENKGSTENLQLIDLFHVLLKRMLIYPIPTIAAVSGHAVAGGCMLALAHDYRLMRADKGFMFLSELDIKIPFSPGMNAIIRCKLPVNTYHKAMLSAHRYSGKTAEEAGMVHGALPDAQSTIQEAVKRAEVLARKNYDRVIYQTIKKEMFKAEIQELEKISSLQQIMPTSPASKL